MIFRPAPILFRALSLFSALILVAGLPACKKAPRTDAVTPVGASAEIGAPAPDFTLFSVEDEKVSLSEFKGKVVMVNFWATWCPPCKKEIPDFMDFQKTYGERGFEILGISLDDDQDAVHTYLTSNPINYFVLFGSPDVAAKYGNIQSIPTTFLVDREGIIRATEVGMMPRSYWEQKIEALL